MRMFSTIIFLLFGFMSLFTSCKKENASVQSFNNFPMSVGTYWKYQVYDSLTQQTDTITINVVKDTMINNNPVFYWESSKAGVAIDTLFVLKTSDSICFYMNINLTDLRRKLKIPFEVGDTWQGNINDYYEVESIESYYLNDAFKINRNYQSFNYYLLEKIWMVDNIGFVKMTTNEFSLAPIKNENWRLLSYHIN